MSPDIARGVLLAAIMEADVVVKPEEIDAGRAILSRAKRREGEFSRGEWGVAIEQSQEIDAALAALAKLDEATRTEVILDLWEMSISDMELHASENTLIHQFAERLGVSALPNGMKQMPIQAGR